MGKRFSFLAGGTLILIGALSLAFTLVGPMFGASVWMWGAWRLWPLLVVAGGLLFVVSPLLARGRRGLGGLFIPGVPILTTGAILLYASVLDAWHAWEWLWPLEILAIAMGFLLASIYMRSIWLLFPAIVVGANGALLQFCALTGLWESWAVLWPAEPLAVGLAFLIVNLRRRSRGLFIAGLIMCVIAAMGLIGMTAVFPRWVLINALGPAVLLLVGLLMLVNNLVRRPAAPEPVAE
jgi:hypothetical protein